MSETEFYYCGACEADECECGGGFYAFESEATCPCCGSEDVQP
jgi:anaerobic ribonucleoside-triphosphate reductase